MPPANIARKAEAEPIASRRPVEAGLVRGAEALLQAMASGTSIPLPTGPQDSGQSRKAVKKAARLIRQATEALDAGRYKAAEALLDEAIALLESPPSQLWFYRLLAADKGANYEYVVNNYPRIRALASGPEEVAVADRIWIDCLVAGGFFREALQEAEKLSAGVAVPPGGQRRCCVVSLPGLADLPRAIANRTPP